MISTSPVRELRSVNGLPIRVMVVDDQDVVRSGLRSLLEGWGALVVAEAADVRSAVEEALVVRPQVIVMDVRLGRESGITATREIRARMPEARILMLTSFPDTEALVASMLAGAVGFILKDVTGDEIARSIAAVARGQLAFDSTLLGGHAFDRSVERLLEQLVQGPEVPSRPGPVPSEAGPSAVVADPPTTDTGTTIQGG